MCTIFVELFIIDNQGTRRKIALLKQKDRLDRNRSSRSQQSGPRDGRADHSSRDRDSRADHNSRDLVTVEPITTVGTT